MSALSANRCWFWLLLIILFRPTNAWITAGHRPLRKRTIVDLSTARPPSSSPLASTNLLKTYPTNIKPNLLPDSVATSSPVTIPQDTLHLTLNGPSDGSLVGSRSSWLPEESKVEKQRDPIIDRLPSIQELLTKWDPARKSTSNAEPTIPQGSAADEHIRGQVAKLVDQFEQLIKDHQPTAHPAQGPNPTYESTERSVRLGSELLSPIKRLRYLFKKFLATSMPQLATNQPAVPGKADPLATVQLLGNVQVPRPTVPRNNLRLAIGRQIPTKLHQTESTSAPAIADKVIVPSYSKTTNSLMLGPTITAGRDILSAPRPPQLERTRASVMMISKIFSKKPLSVTVLSTDQSLSHKEVQTLIYHFLDPELHTRITAFCNALFRRFEGDSQKSSEALQEDQTLALDLPSARKLVSIESTEQPDEAVFSMLNLPLLVSSPALDHGGFVSKNLHSAEGAAASAEGRSLYQMNNIKALFATLYSAAGVQIQFLQVLLERGASISSELPMSHAFDEVRKFTIVKIIKPWSASSQKTVGHIISQIRSLIKPMFRLEAPEQRTGGLHVEALTVPVAKLDQLVPQPYQEIPLRGTSYRKMSLDGDRAVEQPKIAIAAPQQPRHSESSHLSRLMSQKAARQNPIQTTHSLQENTPTHSRPISLQVLLDPKTDTNIFTLYRALFKSSRQFVQGTETRPLHSVHQLDFHSSPRDQLLAESSLRTVSSAGTHQVRDQNVGTGKLIGQPTGHSDPVFQVIGAKTLFVTVNRVVHEYKNFFSGMGRQSSELYSGSVNSMSFIQDKKLTLLNICQAFSSSTQKPLALIVSQIWYIVDRFPSTAALRTFTNKQPLRTLVQGERDGVFSRLTLDLPYKLTGRRSSSSNPTKNQLQLTDSETTQSRLVTPPSSDTRLPGIGEGLGNIQGVPKPIEASSSKIPVTENVKSPIQSLPPPTTTNKLSNVPPPLDQVPVSDPVVAIPGPSLLNDASKRVNRGSQQEALSQTTEDPTPRIRQNLGKIDDLPEKPEARDPRIHAEVIKQLNQVPTIDPSHPTDDIHGSAATAINPPIEKPRELRKDDTLDRNPSDNEASKKDDHDHLGPRMSFYPESGQHQVD
ncbi:hypothetical protein PtB15_16B26 [Puccinia triticina]|nr:hypothetical protein PtB15_16B26 [Puccinia triticina]